MRMTADSLPKVIRNGKNLRGRGYRVVARTSLGESQESRAHFLGC